MTWFKTSTESEAVVTADRARLWAVLTDPALVARLTPLVKRIEADGDHWRWQLEEIPGLGVSLAPAFTVLMDLDEPRRIAFTHDPPEGERERTAVEGVYELAEVEDGTHLAISLTVKVDLPLSRLAKPAVSATMKGVLATMGRSFSDNLLEHLGAEEADEESS